MADLSSVPEPRQLNCAFPSQPGSGGAKSILSVSGGLGHEPEAVTRDPSDQSPVQMPHHEQVLEATGLLGRMRHPLTGKSFSRTGWGGLEQVMPWAMRCPMGTPDLGSLLWAAHRQLWGLVRAAGAVCVHSDAVWASVRFLNSTNHGVFGSFISACLCVWDLMRVHVRVWGRVCVRVCVCVRVGPVCSVCLCMVMGVHMGVLRAQVCAYVCTP